MKTAYIHLRDHHDPVWNKGFEEHAVHPDGTVIRSYSEREAQQFDRWLDLLAAEPDLKLDIEQACTARQYLRMRPDALPVFRALVAEGRIEFHAGGESVIDTNLVHGETICRNLLYGLRWLRETLDARPRVPGCPDTFGLSAQLPQILRQFGFEWLGVYSRVFGGGAKGLETEHVVDHPARAFWRGIDGSLLCIRAEVDEAPRWGAFRNIQYLPCPECRGEGCRLCGYSGLDRFATQDETEALPALQSLREGASSAVRITFLTEETIKHPAFISRLRAAAKEAGVALQFITHGDVPGLWLKAPLERLARGTVAEDEIDVRAEGNPVATGCYVARSALKRRLREAEHLLLAAETLGALAARHGWAYPRKGFAESWRRLCLMAFHDGVTGSHPDTVYGEVRRFDREVRTGAGGHMLAAARHLAARVQTPEAAGAIVVFNPLLQRVRGVLADVAVEHGAFDPDGRRRVADWTMRTVDGRPVPVIEWTGAARDEAVVYRLRFLCPELPACGYTTLLASPVFERADEQEAEGIGEPLSAADPDAPAMRADRAKVARRSDTDGLRETKAGFIENERYRVEWNARGLAAIHDRRLGRCVAGPGTCELTAEDDIGSYWETLARFEMRRNLHGLARIETRAFAGPDGGGPIRKLEVRGRLEQRIDWDLPEGWTRELRYATGLKVRLLTAGEVEVCVRAAEWTLELWLLDGREDLPMRLTVRCDSENVRLTLPFGLGFTTPGDRGWYGIPHGAIERPAYRPIEGVHCAPDGTWPALHWVAAVHPEAGYAAGLLNRGMPAHRFRDGTLWLSLLRSPRIKVWQGSPKEKNRADNPLARDAGTQVFEFAWLSGPDGLTGTRFAHRGAAFNTVFPAVAAGDAEVQALRGRGDFGGQTLPIEQGFLENTAPNVLVEALKLAEDDDALVLRAREAYGLPARDALTGPLAGPAREISPMEDGGSEAPSRLDYRPFEIKTLRL